MDSKETINILDAIIACDYLINNRDYIISLFYDTFIGKKCNIYLTPKFNSRTNKFERILVIRWFISVPLGGRTYDVPILIYLPKMFPSEAPEIYIDRVEEIAVNPKSGNIDKTTLKINVSSLKNWNMSSSSLGSVLSEILCDFSAVFPVYKLDIRDRGKYNYGPDCKLQMENVQSVSFDAPSKGGSSSKYSSSSNKNNYGESSRNSSTHSVSGNSRQLIDFSSINNESNKKPDVGVSFHPKLVTFSDEQIKQIYINELKNQLIPKIKMEKMKLREHEETLLKHSTDFKQQIEQTKSLAERKDEIINKISNLSANIQDQMSVLKNYIEINSQVEFSFSNLEKFVKISDPDLVKVVAAEAVLEDFLFYVKKAYEKKIFSFQETIKLMRNNSRELYTLKMYREKLLRQMNKY